jgi:protein-tyrosine-phosphatase
MAEVVLNKLGRGRFRAYSGGSHPTGKVHPLAIQALQRMDLPTEGLRSKSWDEFAIEDAPRLDFVFTVCDKAAGEICPAWPGQPMTAHWGIEDPATFVGPEDKMRATFHNALVMLSRRIELFLSLPIEKLDRMSLQNRLSDGDRRRYAGPPSSGCP